MWIPKVRVFQAEEMVCAKAMAAVCLLCPGRGGAVAGEKERELGRAPGAEWHDMTRLIWMSTIRSVQAQALEQQTGA